jgi:hypothetical protein
MSMNVLARKAEVDRSSIAKVERHQPVMGSIAGKIFSALNYAHRNDLVYTNEVTTLDVLEEKHR